MPQDALHGQQSVRHVAGAFPTHRALTLPACFAVRLVSGGAQARGEPILVRVLAHQRETSVSRSAPGAADGTTGRKGAT